MSRISSIRNPGTFYFMATEPWNWTAPQNDALWRDEVKTLFDPCPIGWRVPQGGEDDRSPLNRFTVTNGPWLVQNGDAGHMFDHSVVYFGSAWYTACGWRGYRQGTLGAVGGHADIWFATVSGARGCNLYSTSINISPSSAASRSYGFPVRCIRE